VRAHQPARLRTRGRAASGHPARGLVLGVHNDQLELHFEDDGVPFDPRQPVPARPAPSPGSDHGGRGLALVRSVADRLDYERTSTQHNHLTVTIARAGIR
jgi:anti-sigma regulatory factor (Ser/Thr protein kinase)